MKSRIIVGTRGSKLALTQTGMVIKSLKEKHPGLEIDTRIIKTTGDKILDKTLDKIGGKGLFIKEIEDALANKEVDFAVHSMKDVPHTLPKDFEIGAILEREDPRDILISGNNKGLFDLPENAVIGTSSLRRILQLKALRPDIKFQSMRGNVDTRINMLAQGHYDAIVLAAAGLKRMGWKKGTESSFFKPFLKEKTDIVLNAVYIEIHYCIPAVGQGALAIEIRENDEDIYNIVKVLNHDLDAKCVLAERAFLKAIDGGCEIPIGAYCRIKNNKLNMTGFIGDERSLVIYKSDVSGESENYEIIGIKLAKEVLKLKKNNY